MLGGYRRPLYNFDETILTVWTNIPAGNPVLARVP
jgi:hypothetical protein